MFLLCSVLSFSRPLDLSRLNFAQRYVLNGINKKWETYCRSLPEEQRSQIDFGTMMRLLGPAQRDLALKILSVDPTALGSRAPFVSVKTAKDLVRLENTTFEAAATGAATGETGIEYLPEHVYLDYKNWQAR